MVYHLDRYWAADAQYDTETVWQLDIALGISILVLNCFGVYNILILHKFTIKGQMYQNKGEGGFKILRLFMLLKRC
jgi:hypothetical protein